MRHRLMPSTMPLTCEFRAAKLRTLVIEQREYRAHDDTEEYEQNEERYID